MSYIGNTPTTQAFSAAIDYFNGTGSQTAFTLSRPVASVAQIQVVVNNVEQNPSSAFSVSGNTLTFTSAPSSGTNNIYVYYVSPITQLIAPGQNTVTTASIVDGNVTLSKLSATGTPSSTTYLRGDNTWATVSGGVTSLTAGTGISLSGSTGAVTVTNSGVTTLTAGTGISLSGSTGGVTVTSTATGTVTSVATGNGLQGGTITSSGTLSIAAPGFNTVGSYVNGIYSAPNNASFSSGQVVSAGAGQGYLQSYGASGITPVNNLSGTWRWMGAPGPGDPCGRSYYGVYCRVA